MERIKIGIIGSGWIAQKMAITLAGIPEAEPYAIASRDLQKAQAFAADWNFTTAYGSYEEMVQDENVQLVYIASPHSHHYEHAKLCLMHNKPILCEKAFTATAWQAEEILRLAKQRNIFVAEAIWTRYMPLSHRINQLIESGIIGDPRILSANLGYPNWLKERMYTPELAGGALLDLGVYPINFAFMVFGSNFQSVTSTCTKIDTGMDAQESITFTYADGRMAVLYSTMMAKTDRQCVVSGTEGHLLIENCNNPQSITVVNSDYQVIERHDAPQQITGYEYQVYACIEALRNGWLETPYMPHAETLHVMQVMDQLRQEWGVRYPWDNW